MVAIRNGVERYHLVEVSLALPQVLGYPEELCVVLVYALHKHHHFKIYMVQG